MNKEKDIEEMAKELQGFLQGIRKERKRINECHYQ